MATSQQILQAVTQMQQNAQGRLPVIPNNGNPGTVYNTSPATVQQPPPAAPPVRPGFEWLQASPSLQRVRELSQRIRGAVQPAVAPQQPAPMTAVAQPILPTRRY